MPAWLDYAAWRTFRLFRRLHLTGVLRLGTKTGRFVDYFKGFDKVEAVKGIFGDKTQEVLRNLKVEFTWFGYMGVDPSDGHLLANEHYLNTGDKMDIYLDVIHELCHVKQWMDGKELFDPQYDYVDRPTEVEAYAYAVKEARKLGWTDERICRYLKTEWMSNEDLKRLADNIGVKC
ncbi:MAG: hypothetical protein ACE14S_09100 [Candidatus Bathyarchaeia archaeon]